MDFKDMHKAIHEKHYGDRLSKEELAEFNKDASIDIAIANHIRDNSYTYFPHFMKDMEERCRELWDRYTE